MTLGTRRMVAVMSALAVVVRLRDVDLVWPTYVVRLVVLRLGACTGSPDHEPVCLEAVRDLPLETAYAGRLIDRLKAEFPFPGARSYGPSQRVGEVNLMTRRECGLVPCAVYCPT